MAKNKSNISAESFSPHLFWDVNPAGISFNRDKDFVVKKVLLYGVLKDWNNILKLYGLYSIVDSAKKIRELDKRTLSFLSLLSDTPMEDFLCYTTKPSKPAHWNF